MHCIALIDALYSSYRCTLWLSTPYSASFYLHQSQVAPPSRTLALYPAVTSCGSRRSSPLSDSSSAAAATTTPCRGPPGPEARVHLARDGSGQSETESWGSDDDGSAAGQQVMSRISGVLVPCAVSFQRRTRMHIRKPSAAVLSGREDSQGMRPEPALPAQARPDRQSARRGGCRGWWLPRRSGPQSPSRRSRCRAADSGSPSRRRPDHVPDGAAHTPPVTAASPDSLPVSSRGPCAGTTAGPKQGPPAPAPACPVRPRPSLLTHPPADFRSCAPPQPRPRPSGLHTRRIRRGGRRRRRRRRPRGARLHTPGAARGPRRSCQPPRATRWPSLEPRTRPQPRAEDRRPAESSSRPAPAATCHLSGAVPAHCAPARRTTPQGRWGHGRVEHASPLLAGARRGAASDSSLDECAARSDSPQGTARPAQRASR